MRRTRAAAAAAISISANNAVAPPPIKPKAALRAAIYALHSCLAEVDLRDSRTMAALRLTFLAVVPSDMRQLIANHLVLRRGIDYVHAVLNTRLPRPTPSRYGTQEAGVAGDNRNYMRSIGLTFTGDVDAATGVSIAGIVDDYAVERALYMYINDYIVVTTETCTYVTKAGHYIGCRRTSWRRIKYIGMGIVCYDYTQTMMSCFDLDRPDDEFTIRNFDPCYMSILPCGLAVCHSTRMILNARTRQMLHVPELREIGKLSAGIFMDDYGDWFYCYRDTAANCRAQILGADCC